MSKFFIRRPIVAMVIAIIMVIVGAVAMLQLPTAQFPNIAPPEIMVQATYPGADAQTLEQAVATPIEEQISGVDKMLYMYSLNANSGQSTIYVDFDVTTDPNTDQVAHSDASGPGSGTDACSGKPGWNHGAKVSNVASDVAIALFPQGKLRQCLCGELRLHQSGG
jgi:hypothetical protein